MYPLRRYRILVVDDDPDARRQLHRLLAANGHSVCEAGNGRMACSLLQDGDLDLVISDILMPECDGFELIAAIRALHRPMPVIAMSDAEGWAGLNFLNAANDLGAAAVIEKPFRAAVLLRLLDGALALAHREPCLPTLGVLAVPAPACIPAGLEWVGGRPSGLLN